MAIIFGYVYLSQIVFLLFPAGFPNTFLTNWSEGYVACTVRSSLNMSISFEIFLCKTPS